MRRRFTGALGARQFALAAALLLGGCAEVRQTESANRGVVAKFP
jgi:hypothetical protein